MRALKPPFIAGAPTRRFLYEPGNGTRYNIVVCPYPNTTGRSRWVFVLADFPRGVSVTADHALHFSYIQEKTGLGEVDAQAFAAFLEIFFLV